MITLIANLYRKAEAKSNLIRVFNLSKIYKSHKYNGKEIITYPNVHEVTVNEHLLRFTFTLPDGVNPQSLEDNMYTFQQVFGEHIEIEGNIKRFVLKVYRNGLPKKIHFNYDEWKEKMDEMTLPIICGRDLNNRQILFDLVESPHVFLSGETGSGKSSLLRVILTSLMINKTPDKVQFILGDLKKSEFGLYRGLPHVQGVHTYVKTLKPALKKLKKEMERRGELLDKNGVQHIRELKVELPYIIIVIDEVFLLKKEKDVMSIIEEIGSIGRSLGCILMLSMQRGDSKLLEGSLKINLTVRISGRQADSTNAKIAGVPNSDKIKMSDKGRMLIKLDKLIEFQSPHLEFDEAKKLLQPLKTLVKDEPLNYVQVETDKQDEIQFNVINEEELSIHE